MELLLGCGGSRFKKLVWRGRSGWDGLVTLDNEPRHGPDVVHDLNLLPLPFESDQFSEIHAYEVLEHTGTQGDYRFFFGQWSEFWRILKPDGVFLGSVPLPTSPWAWGDPSHTRVIPKESFTFLSQAAYAQVGTTPMSDFRSIYEADFRIEFLDEQEHNLFFALSALK